jgi:hypothetical protein
MNKNRLPMAMPLDSNDLVTFKELLMANLMQVDAPAQLMIRRDIITKEELIDMLKEAQAEYPGKIDD